MCQVSRRSSAVHGAVHWLYVAGAVGRLDSELEGFVSVNKRLAAATAEHQSRQQEPDSRSELTDACCRKQSYELSSQRHEGHSSSCHLQLMICVSVAKLSGLLATQQSGESAPAAAHSRLICVTQSNNPQIKLSKQTLLRHSLVGQSYGRQSTTGQMIWSASRLTELIMFDKCSRVCVCGLTLSGFI